MKRVQRRQAILIVLAVVGSVSVLNFLGTFINKTFGTIRPCLCNSRIIFNESGVIDKSSRWRKLAKTEYVFTAYLDDREPCTALITVLGFGEMSDSPLHGTLLLYSGERIQLGKYKKKMILNPYGDYSFERLGPCAYSWPLPAMVSSVGYLKSIEVRQIGPHAGTKTNELFNKVCTVTMFRSKIVTIFVRNTQVYKICKFCQAIFYSCHKIRHQLLQFHLFYYALSNCGDLIASPCKDKRVVNNTKSLLVILTSHN